MMMVVVMVSCLSVLNRRLFLDLNGSETEYTNSPKQETQSYFPSRSRLVTKFIFTVLESEPPPVGLSAHSRADWFSVFL